MIVLLFLFLSLALGHPELEIDDVQIPDSESFPSGSEPSLEDNDLELIPGILKRLQENDPSLLALSLKGIRIPDSDIVRLAEALKRNSVVRGVDVSRTQLSDKSAELLLLSLHNRQLQWLDMSGNDLTDHVAPTLESFLSTVTDLVLLDLGYNFLGPESSAAISRAIMTLPHAYLKTLYLRFNVIGDQGATSISDLLQNPNCPLLKLDLRQSGINTQGARALFTALQKNTNIRILNLGNDPKELHGMKNNIDDDVVETLVSALVVHPSLKELDLIYLSLSDVFAERIATDLHKVEVESFLLKGNQIGDQGAKALAIGLTQNNHILHFSVGSKIGDEGISAISESLRYDKTPIRLLDLSKNNFTDKGCESLSSSILLTESLLGIYLSENSISDSCVDSIFGNLESESSWIKRNIHLRAISLDNANLSTVSIQKIASYLESNIQLTLLDLGNNNITDEGAKILSRSLVHNRYLQHLSLASGGLTSVGARYLAWWLQKMTKRSSSFDYEDQWVEGNDFLALYLDGNKIGNSGAEYLARALWNNPVMEHLSITWNDISDPGASEILETLKKNKVLKTVEVVTGNRIGRRIAREIGEELEKRKDVVEEEDVYEEESGVFGNLILVLMLVGGFWWLRRR